MFHASVTVRQCDPDPGWQHPPSSHEPNKNVFSIGGAARLCCLKKEKKKRKRKGGGGAPFLYLDSPPQSHLLPLTSFNSSPPCSHLSTHFNTHAHTKPPSGPCGRGQGGSGRINFLPWPSTKLLPGTAVTGGERKRKKKKKKWTEGKMEIPDKEKYLPLVSLLKSKASTIKV